MKLTAYALLVFSFIGAIAQETVTIDNNSRISSSNYSNKVTYYNVDDGDVILLNEDTLGSPFLFEEYKLGSIYVHDSLTVPSIAVKYNAFNDAFLVKTSLSTPNEEAQGITKSKDLKIKLGNSFFIALPSMENPLELQYYELLSQGKKGNLLKKNDKVYKERIEATTSLTRDVPASFKDHTSFFFQRSNGDFYELPTSKKKFLAVFGDEKKKVSALLKEHNINIKKESDLIKFFKHYETI